MDKLIQHLKKSAASPLRDCGMVLALLLINGFYFCEAKYPPQLMNVVRLLLALLLVTSLPCFGFWNGVLRRPTFALFLAAFWLVPQAGIFLLSKYSEIKGWGRMLYDLSVLLGKWPFETFAGQLSISFSIIASLIFLITLCFFGLGWALRLKNRRMKCKITTANTTEFNPASL